MENNKDYIFILEKTIDNDAKIEPKIIANTKIIIKINKMNNKSNICINYYTMKSNHEYIQHLSSSSVGK